MYAVLAKGSSVSSVAYSLYKNSFLNSCIEKVRKIWNSLIFNKKDAFCVIETIEALDSQERQLQVELLKLVPLSRGEKNCLSYDLYLDRENSRRFTIIMHWKTKEDYNKHNETTHILEFMKKFENKLYTNDTVTEHTYVQLA